MLFRAFGHDFSGYKTGGVEGDFGAWEGGEERVVEEPAERGRVTRSVCWCDEERGLEEPAERERVARSVRWCGKEQVVVR